MIQFWRTVCNLRQEGSLSGKPAQLYATDVALVDLKLNLHHFLCISLGLKPCRKSAALIIAFLGLDVMWAHVYIYVKLY